MMQSLHLPTLRSLLSSVDQPFIHRDLSWLQFNERVLSEAREPSNPLLERLKFLAISFSNLDEFFMIRYASLEKSLTKLHRQQKLDEFERLKLVKNHIWKRVEQLQRLQSEAFSHLVLELEAAGIDVNCRGHRDPSLAEMGKKIFLESI